jgi:DUF4097 and DUF4098 domain-containing protein YvlB
MTVRLSIAVASLVTTTAVPLGAQPLPVATVPPVIVLPLASPSGPDGQEPKADATDMVVRTFKVGPRGSLDITNLSGNIVIIGKAGDTIVVKATKHVWGRDSRTQLETLNIDATETAGRVEVRTVFGRRHETKGEVDYEVEVPFDTEVTAKSLSGDVKAVKVRGEVQLESTNGNVEAIGTTRLTRVKTISGDLMITDAASPDALSASTVSGDVTAKSLKTRALEIVTVSGDLRLLNTACERAQVRTLNGTIEFVGLLAKGGRYEFNSHSGDVILHLAGSQGFELSATTFSGDVHSALPLLMPSRPGDDDMPGIPRNRETRGTFGDGGALIVVKTFNGDVTLDKAEGGPIGKDKAGKKQ